MAELVKTYLNPEDVLVNVQGVQNVLPFRVLHDTLDLPITSIRNSDVQQTFQDTSGSQLENDDAVLDAEPSEVVSPQVRVDQDPSNECDERVPQRGRRNQPRQRWRQDGDCPRGRWSRVMLCHSDVVAICAEDVDEREESLIQPFFRHRNVHILDREKQLALICGECAL